MRDAGRGVFVISADLDEIFSLSDRILVMYRGRIVADLVADETDVEEVGRLMGGLHESRSAADVGQQGAATTVSTEAATWRGSSVSLLRPIPSV